MPQFPPDRALRLQAGEEPSEGFEARAQPLIGLLRLISDIV